MSAKTYVKMHASFRVLPPPPRIVHCRRLPINGSATPRIRNSAPFRISIPALASINGRNPHRITTPRFRWLRYKSADFLPEWTLIYNPSSHPSAHGEKTRRSGIPGLRSRLLRVSTFAVVPELYYYERKNQKGFLAGYY